MFKRNGIPRVLLGAILGVMLSTLVGCEPSQFASEQGLSESSKLAQRAWWIPWLPPKK